MKLTQFTVDEGPHDSDGLVPRGRDGPQPVERFISRRVMDDWVDPVQSYGIRKSLFRAQYNALGKRNLPTIERIVTATYPRGPAFKRPYPLVDVLLADMSESGDMLDRGELVR
jgi:hypothetical protein